MQKRIIFILTFFLILIIIGFIYIHKRKLTNMTIEKSFNAMEKLVIQSLPKTASTDSIHTIFSQTVDKVKKGEIKAHGLQSIALTFQAQFSDGVLDSSEAYEILDRISNISKNNEYVPLSQEKPFQK